MGNIYIVTCPFDCAKHCILLHGSSSIHQPKPMTIGGTCSTAISNGPLLHSRGPPQSFDLCSTSSQMTAPHLLGVRIVQWGMFTIRITSDDVPIPALVERLTRDRRNAVQSSITTSHPDIRSWGSVILSAVYKRSYVGACSRVWSIMLDCALVFLRLNIQPPCNVLRHWCCTSVIT